MSKTVDQAIQELQAEIAADELGIGKKKDTVNALCGVIGRAPIYSPSHGPAAAPAHAGPIRSDQFYGQPLASSVRVILEMRRAANLGAATINEIYDALTSGGFRFDTKNEDIARKSLRNSLAKNVALFHKLPKGQFGLAAWYPKVPRGVRGAQESSSNDEDEADDSASAKTPDRVTEAR